MVGIRGGCCRRFPASVWRYGCFVHFGLLGGFAGRCRQGRVLMQVSHFRSMLSLNRVDPGGHIVSVWTRQGENSPRTYLGESLPELTTHK